MILFLYHTWFKTNKNYIHIFMSPESGFLQNEACLCKYNLEPGLYLQFSWILNLYPETCSCFESSFFTPYDILGT